MCNHSESIPPKVDFRAPHIENIFLFPVASLAATRPLTPPADCRIGGRIRLSVSSILPFRRRSFPPPACCATRGIGPAADRVPDRPFLRELKPLLSRSPPSQCPSPVTTDR